MPNRERYDVVIVGSGFGGAVAALRLSQAGRSVCVLERGRNFRDQDRPFPESKVEYPKLFWTEAQDGHIDVRFYPDIAVVVGSGLGGGSLVYANVHYLPDAEMFTEGGWPAELGDRRVLAPYYARVADMLKIRPATKDLPKIRAMEEAAHALGKELRPVDLAVYFTDDPAQEGVRVEDPFNRGGPWQAPCQHIGRCNTGCNYRSKNTLDLNYLWFAEKRYSAEMATGHVVRYVEPAGDGGYLVHYTLRGGDPEDLKVVHGRTVILAAGSLGSTEILLRSKHQRKTLPRVSDALGLGFSGNADFLAGAVGVRPDLPVDPSRGPVITRSIELKEHRFIIEDAGYPENLAGLAELAASTVGAFPAFLRGLLSGSSTALDLGNLLRDLVDMRGSENLLPLLLMGEDAADGKIRLVEDGRLEVQWENTRSARTFQAMEDAAATIARHLQGTVWYSPLWLLVKRLITVHPLGGCVLADSPEDGVVNPKGEVFNYPGLYVADGAIVPRAVGKNPAFTIAALAERIAFWLVHKREIDPTRDPAPEAINR
ncbi:MAG: GMC family oxidoreductase [Nitrospinae bacterium]|nr:GMC family oxidoreductase [Nitrospinota bacterium]